MKNANPLEINFLNAELQYRRRHATLRNETLIRALNLKQKDKDKIIIDATVGLGRDSFILASLGFNVIMLERSPIIYELLMNAMKAAEKNEENKSIISRMHLQLVDAITYLPSTTAHMVYIDPMFPAKKKSALSKKEMRIFHEIVGNDDDADQLLTASLACATERVVVKRPRLAENIKGLKPTYSLEGSSSRFDIYITSTK